MHVEIGPPPRKGDGQLMSAIRLTRTTLNVRDMFANSRPLQIFRIKYGVCQHIEGVRVEVLRMWCRTLRELAL
eukprot:SAG25_NODE_92_length_16062_cov_54.931095_9_plen_73_part_00